MTASSTALPAGCAMFSLVGKVVFVTGAARGLGHGLALGLAGLGAHVVMADRDPEVEHKAAAASAAGLSASPLMLDLLRRDDIADAVADTVTRFGQLDVVINNAGILVRKAATDLADEEWQAVIDTNLSACFFMAREAARVMVDQGSGRIINIGSIVGHVARPRLSAYIAAKGGIAALTRALAADFAGTGITVNSIAPGFMITDMSQASDGRYRRYIDETVPARRWGTPQDLVGTAALIASDAGSYINGQTIYVDGGFTSAVV